MSNATSFVATTPLLLIPVSFVCAGISITPYPDPAGTSGPAPSPATPAPAAKESTTTSTAASTPPGAGLPAALVALLRSGTEGPFHANEVYSTSPTEPLAPIEEVVPAPEWYTITRGRFVGVVDQYALSTVAITGVAHGARKAYTTQALALDAFNRALTWGGVQVA